MSDIVQLVPTVKVRDIPSGLFIEIEVEDYEIKINSRLERPEIVIEYVMDSSRWGMVKIVGPDPEASIDEIVREAQALIEKFMRKKASTAEA